MQLLNVAPQFASADFDRTVTFYSTLGFKEAARYDQRYLILRCDGVELHFNQVGAEHNPATCRNSAYARFLNVRSLCRVWGDLGLPGAGIPRYVPPATLPWGMIEAHTVDPDGNLIIYGAPVEDTPPDSAS